jgi:hypothetical protein
MFFYGFKCKWNISISKYLLKIVYTISLISCKKIFLKLRIYIFKNLLDNKVSLKEFKLEEKAKLLSTYFGAKRIRGTY